ncbi:hypothetical protein MKK84_24480 [Methylobacterium sp. E-065]|uniref:hypothetical protein n=1 Tax=Methylobacterium sp. E-065 TaxID=2836583 RepID=UPI001FB877BA|nr:hypothetical protein [Methylobacterium sp. E-065]MCJ2020545.1 hypothetical protein [Methylobacterium sp. E-065]
MADSTITRDLIFPRELTPKVKDVLSIMCFEAGPIARAFREAGRAEIKTRAEDEQAFVLHWLLTFALEHGAEWRRRAGETLTPVIAEAEAATTAKVAERAAREVARAGRG